MSPIRSLNYISFSILMTAVLISGCNTDSKSSKSRKSVEHLIEFVVSGDSNQLHDIFADSVLDAMSIEDMISTREDLLARFGKLENIEKAIFTSDSTAEVVMHYEQISLLATINIDSQCKIDFISIRPAPIEEVETNGDDSKIIDLHEFNEFKTTFNTDSDYVRLVSILSPT